MKSVSHSSLGRSKPAVVMLTDFGGDSFYVGALKGAVLSVDPDATIVDLTHGIRPYSVDEGSFVLARTFGLFAEGTVYLAVVDPGVGGERKNLAFVSKGRYLVAPDNGLVSDIEVEHGIESTFSITEDAVAEIRKHRDFGQTFLGRDVFAPAAAYLANGGPVSHLGPRIDVYETLTLPSVEYGTHLIKGSSRYVDSFGNILTNISGSDIKRVFGNTPLAQIHISVNNTVGVDGIDDYFSRAKMGELMVILNSWNLVEISVNQGRAIDRFPDAGRIDIELTLV
ncbi:MAG: SAM-dependent chlorinase/fluorinase [Candidatus Latescibacterota bacterium]|nr:MAG: SAM-dependent chlorinase/fluorinase [Candidatus Latescibacterota bacterium]